MSALIFQIGAEFTLNGEVLVGTDPVDITDNVIDVLLSAGKAEEHVLVGQVEDGPLGKFSVTVPSSITGEFKPGLRGRFRMTRTPPGGDKKPMGIVKVTAE